jgi:hypothetical protein
MAEIGETGHGTVAIGMEWIHGLYLGRLTALNESEIEH